MVENTLVEIIGQETIVKIGTELQQLKSRWMDEREYEDWNDYIEYVKKILPSNASFVRLSKKPFGVWFNVEGKLAQIRVTFNEIAWGMQRPGFKKWNREHQRKYNHEHQRK